MIPDTNFQYQLKFLQNSGKSGNPGKIKWLHAFSGVHCSTFRDFKKVLIIMAALELVE